MYRQGDVLVRPLRRDQKIKGAEVPPEGGRVILAHGEATGHAHAFQRGAVMFRDDGGGGGTFVRIKKGGADLVHEEHTTHRIPAGDHRVIRQLEYSEQDIHQVAD